MNHLIVRWTTVLVCSLMAACSSAPKEDLSKVTVKSQLSQAETRAWLLEKESALRDSIKGSPFTLHQQDSVLVVTAPAQQSFNPDRPGLLLPAVLAPITRIAKLMEADTDSSVLILGHTADSKDNKANQKLSTDRARSVASIFRLSGLSSGRMTHLGMGSAYQLAQVKNISQHHRVEIIIMPNLAVRDVMAEYRPAYVRQLALSQAD